MADVCKQYTVEEAYTDNLWVRQYVDGVLENEMIVAYWELAGYCRCVEQNGFVRAYDVEKAERRMRVEQNGFVRAYDVEKAERRMREAKEVYEYALEEFEAAKQSALIVNNKRK